MQLYGIDFTAKSKDSVDVQLFKRYCYMADFKPSPGIAYTPLPIEPISGNAFKPDIDFLNTTVPEESLRIYEAYVRSSPGRLLPSSRDMLWQPEDRSHEYVAYMKSGVAF